MPIHELGNAAGLIHNIGAGLQIQVVGVTEDGLRTGRANLFRCQGFHSSARTHGDKSGCVNIPVGSVDSTSAAQWLPGSTASDSAICASVRAGGFTKVRTQGEGGGGLLVYCHGIF